MALRYYLDQTKNIFDPSEAIGTLQRLRRETLEMGEIGLHLLATSSLRSRQVTDESQPPFDAVAVLEPLLCDEDTDSVLRILAITRRRCGCKHFLGARTRTRAWLECLDSILRPDPALTGWDALAEYKASGFREALGLAFDTQFASTEEALDAVIGAAAVVEFPETISYPALGLANELTRCEELDFAHRAIVRIAQIDPGWHYPHICAALNRWRAFLQCGHDEASLDMVREHCTGVLTTIANAPTELLPEMEATSDAADFPVQPNTRRELMRHATATTSPALAYCAGYILTVVACVDDGRAIPEAANASMPPPPPGFMPPDEGMAPPPGGPPGPPPN